MLGDDVGCVLLCSAEEDRRCLKCIVGPASALSISVCWSVISDNVVW
ncbi:hypothetical protein [Haladaptatus sp. AB643]|nr:hypothetical protein [Haladaptatus sp. AB643]MCO8244737.1 hypothetical protein [Haladaptatus sp. AB643]